MLFKRDDVLTGFYRGTKQSHTVEDWAFMLNDDLRTFTRRVYDLGIQDTIEYPRDVFTVHVGYQRFVGNRDDICKYFRFSRRVLDKYENSNANNDFDYSLSRVIPVCLLDTRRKSVSFTYEGTHYEGITLEEAADITGAPAATLVHDWLIYPDMPFDMLIHLEAGFNCRRYQLTWNGEIFSDITIKMIHYMTGINYYYLYKYIVATGTYIADGMMCQLLDDVRYPLSPSRTYSYTFAGNTVSRVSTSGLATDLDITDREAILFFDQVPDYKLQSAINEYMCMVEHDPVGYHVKYAGKEVYTSLYHIAHRIGQSYLYVFRWVFWQGRQIQTLLDDWAKFHRGDEPLPPRKLYSIEAGNWYYNDISLYEISNLVDVPVETLDKYIGDVACPDVTREVEQAVVEVL